MNIHSNLARLEYIATKLAYLVDDFVFVGGSITGLLVTDPNIPGIRITLDVDCVVDALSLTDYHKIEQQLRALGFNQSPTSEVICRWNYDGVILDVMPTTQNVLGFSNIWYSGAINNATSSILNDNIKIKYITAPYFIATKFEAFKHRGNNDYRGSHDLEDIVTIVDGRPELYEDIAIADKILQEYICNAMKHLLSLDAFLTALPGILNDYGYIAPQRARLVLQRIQDIANIAS